MVQNTIWFWVMISAAGLLSLVVSIIMVFMNKDTTRFYWRRTFSVALCIGYVLGLSGFLWPPGQVSDLYNMGTLVYSMGILLLCLYLFFNPAILYGSNFSITQIQMPNREIPQVYQQELNEVNEINEVNETKELKEKMPSPAARTSLTIEQSLKYQKIIKDHFAESLAFRKPGYAIRDLSNETGIPGYLVSLFINQEYGMNFNEFVNANRVEYLAGLLKTSFNCEAYTLEAIGKMAGFNSRTAFIAAIKKYTGMTPSAFFGRKDREVIEYSIFNFPERMRDVA